jgi:hypothetical protein
MITCIICRFECEVDDVAIQGTNGHGVCVRCFARETGNERPMPKTLRRELTVVLGELEVV